MIQKPLWTCSHEKDYLFIKIICWPITTIQSNGPLILCCSTPYKLISFFEFVPYDKPSHGMWERYSVKVNKCPLNGYKIKGLWWMIRHWHQVTDCSVTSIIIQNDLFICLILMIVKSKIECKSIYCKDYLIFPFQKRVCPYNQLS